MMSAHTRKFKAAARAALETPGGLFRHDPVMSSALTALSPGFAVAVPFIDDATVRRRAWALLDWLVRICGPCCLAAQPLQDIAEALCELPEVTEGADILRHTHAWVLALDAARAHQQSAGTIAMPAALWSFVDLCASAAIVYAPDADRSGAAEFLVSWVMRSVAAGLNGVDAAHRAALFEVLEQSARAKTNALMRV